MPPSWPRFPVYGGWPGAVLYPPPPEPYPEPDQQPGFEPEPAPATEPNFGQDDADTEIPPAFLSSVNQLPPSQRPNYVRIGYLPDAVRQLGAADQGLYLIVFNSNNRTRAYSGQSGNLRRRLQQHLLCALMFDMPAHQHEVFIARTPGMSDAQRRAIELRIHTEMFASHRGVLTNQRRELEAELLGEAWLT
ncbi:MAG: hypothetical protein ABIT83_11360 [Massilia sp.]